MSTVAKKAILRALVDGAVTELLVKSKVDNIYVDDTKLLSTWMSEVLADIALKANAEEMNTALAGKAAASHTHEQSEVTGLTEALSKLASTESMNAAIAALKQEMLGDTPVDAYNTFTELAKYIEEHGEAADALTTAVGNKADKAAFEALQATVEALGALAAKDKVSESDLDAALAEKVNAAAEGNHSHANKTVLDGITAEKVAAWDASEKNANDYADGLAKNYDIAGAAAAAESAAKEYADGLNTAMDTRVKAVEGTSHTHANKDVIDGITATKVAAWDAKGRMIVSDTQPVDLTATDLWVQIVE